MQNSLILAPGSPRRSELLSLMGITYQICPADVDEHMTGAPDEVVMALSRRKALAVAERHSGCTVLGADTLVACRGEIMGKPQDQQDAMRMLMLLSGGENNVYTGVTVIDGKTGRVDTRCDQTRVHFVPITPRPLSATLTAVSLWTRLGLTVRRGWAACSYPPSRAAHPT